VEADLSKASFRECIGVGVTPPSSPDRATAPLPPTHGPVPRTTRRIELTRRKVAEPTHPPAVKRTREQDVPNEEEVREMKKQR
jgi:hypothetical protein